MNLQLLLAKRIFILLFFLLANLHIANAVTLNEELEQLQLNVYEALLSGKPAADDVQNYSQILLASQFFISTANVKQSFLQDIDKDTSRLSQQATTYLQALQALALQAKDCVSATSACSDVKMELAALSKRLPLHKEQPYISAITPLILSGRDVAITITGNFPTIPEQVLSNNEPVIAKPLLSFTQQATKVAGSGELTYFSQTTSLQPTQIDENSITFLVDIDALRGNGGSYTPLFLTAKLSLPHSYRRFFANKVRTDSYDLIFGLLPALAGSFTLSYAPIPATTPISIAAATKSERTKTYIQQSTNRDINETYCLPNNIKETAIPGSVELIGEDAMGDKEVDWAYFKQGDCFNVETYFEPGGQSGSLSFYLRYDIAEEVEVPVLAAATNATSTADIIERYILTWGLQQVISLPNATTVWHIEYTNPFGVSVALNKPTELAGYTVVQEGNTLIVSTPAINNYLTRYK